tara:strand:+ start:2427 stop:2744 length:318 start_codon:yes stop_codon:yes gene_type:complete
MAQKNIDINDITGSIYSNHGTVQTSPGGGGVSGINQTKIATAPVGNYFTAIFSSTSNVYAPTTPKNHDITILNPPPSGSRPVRRGLLRGRRPNFGLLFPRGVYGR